MKSHVLYTLAAAAACGLSAAPAQERSRDLVRPAERVVNVRALAFSADGKQLAACSGEPTDPGELVVWDAKTHEVRWTNRIERGMPSLAFSPDGKTLAVGSFTENCFLFDSDTGKVLATLPGHGESARSVAFHPDGKTLAVGSYDQTIRLWDWRAGRVTKQLTGQADKVYSVAYTTDGKRIASGGPGRSACLWDAAGGKLLHRWDSGSMPVAFDPRGEWLATAGNDSSVSIWSVKDYDRVLAHYDYIFAYRFLVLHPTAKSFAAHSGMDTAVRIFPIDLRQATPADEQRVRELVARWDEESFAEREKASQDLVRMGDVTRPLLAKAAREAASAEVRIRAREVLRLLGTPKSLADLRGHDETVLCAAFSPDGQTLVTGGRDGRVLLWDTATYQRRTTMEWPKHVRKGES
jgi:WD40 repeat protein